MAALAAVKAPDQIPEPAAARLDGRLEAVEKGRLYGWAWNADAPASRLAVSVHAGAREIASAIAEKPRMDLRRNGIGDGAHAFDIALPAEVSADQLRVVVTCPESGSELVLAAPTADDRAAAIALAPMQPVFERLDLIVAAQRRLQLIQKENADALKEAARRLDAMADQEARVAEALDTVRSGQSELTTRLDQMEVFLTRFDGSLSGFDARLETLASRGRDEMKPQLFMLAVLVGLVAGIGVSFLLRL